MEKKFSTSWNSKISIIWKVLAYILLGISVLAVAIYSFALLFGGSSNPPINFIFIPMLIIASIIPFLVFYSIGKVIGLLHNIDLTLSAISHRLYLLENKPPQKKDTKPAPEPSGSIPES